MVFVWGPKQFMACGPCAGDPGCGAAMARADLRIDLLGIRGGRLLNHLEGTRKAKKKKKTNGNPTTTLYEDLYE